MTPTGTNQLMPESGGPLLCYHVAGPVTVEEYSGFLERVQACIRDHGEFRLLLLYDNFPGWEAEAANMDVSFYIEYGRYLKKFCLINPPEKEIMSKMISRPMIGGELRVFSLEHKDQAFAWVRS